MASVRPTALRLHPVCPEAAIGRSVPHFLSRVDCAPLVLDCSTCGANDPSIHPLSCGDCRAPACFGARTDGPMHRAAVRTAARGPASTAGGPGTFLVRLAARAAMVLADPARWFLRKSAQGGSASASQAREPRAPETAA